MSYFVNINGEILLVLKNDVDVSFDRRSKGFHWRILIGAPGEKGRPPPKSVLDPPMRMLVSFTLEQGLSLWTRTVKGGVSNDDVTLSRTASFTFEQGFIIMSARTLKDGSNDDVMF